MSEYERLLDKDMDAEYHDYVLEDAYWDYLQDISDCQLGPKEHRGLEAREDTFETKFGPTTFRADEPRSQVLNIGGCDVCDQANI
jgi:hypothetical protein